MSKYIAKMTGYKATNADMTCNGFKYELGKWYEHDGEIELCKSGFHFCVHPSGPWAYYSAVGTRIFKVEAEQVLDIPTEAGTDFKLVAKRIRLVEEIIPTGYRNTGNRNTGDRNTGDRNTGNRNTGNRNTGYANTGNGNTGDRNTGDANTGYANTGNGNTGYANTGNGNTGDRNTGDANTGDANTGDGNTGYANTGNRNTGNGNTGDGNTTDYCTGFFCQKESKIICFDIQTRLTHQQFLSKYPQYLELCQALSKPDPISYEDFKLIPGITKRKLASLHKKHLDAKTKKP